MSHSFTVPHRLNANYSLLGRIIRRSVKDAHVAEGVLILTIALLAILTVVGFYIAWAFVQPIVESDTTGTTALIFFLSQAGSLLLFLLISFAGIKPSIKIVFQDQFLQIEQGSHNLLLLVSEIESAEFISAIQFHRHYRKYLSTRSFFNQLPDTLLLLNTARGPIVLGIREEDQATLLDALRSSASENTQKSLAFVA